ncbi:galactose oxidase [Pedobacter hiemivivus]|uniref:Galactose oxidase n=2 Tax=Pedobacter hiemivivus TaxID=2530454 RepID=A0A4U1GTT8_9SPHI|nr:galactose oxidase [Pedobacter hiemivivus]
MYKYFFLFFYIMLITAPVFSQEIKDPSVEWIVAASLQNVEGNISLGFAGAINAVHNNVLIVAGGANFPDKMPWDGGRKYYSSEIHVLQKSINGFHWNKQVTEVLPEPIAYCGNTSTPAGVVYAGGENDKVLSNKAYKLNWDNHRNKVTVVQLPNLPIAVTNMALTSIGNVVYAVGGDLQKKSSNAFFSLDLNQQNPEWKVLPNLPIALGNAVVVVQKDRLGTNIFVIGGRTKTASGISDLHATTYVYNVSRQNWQELAPISDGKNVTNFSAGAGVGIGDRWILITGGDNGKTFHKIENYLAQIAQTDDVELKARLIKEKNEISIHHRGFYRGMLLYNTMTNEWSKIADLPFPAQVTTTATMWNGNIVLSNGGVKPGIRTPNVMLGVIK